MRRASKRTSGTHVLGRSFMLRSRCDTSEQKRVGFGQSVILFSLFSSTPEYSYTWYTWYSQKIIGESWRQIVPHWGLSSPIRSTRPCWCSSKQCRAMLVCAIVGGKTTNSVALHLPVPVQRGLSTRAILAGAVQETRTP